MSVMKAKDFMLYLDDGAGGAKVALLCASEVSINIETDDDVIDCKGDEFKKRAMGTHDWTGSASGFVIVDTGVTAKTIATLQLNRTEVIARFSTEIAGDFYYEGPCFIKSHEVSGGTSGGAAYSVSLVSAGNLEVLDVPVV